MPKKFAEKQKKQTSLGKRKKEDEPVVDSAEDEDARMMKYLGKKLGISKHSDEKKMMKALGLHDLFDGISAGAKYGLPSDFASVGASDDEAPSEEDNEDKLNLKSRRSKGAAQSNDSDDDQSDIDMSEGDSDIDDPSSDEMDMEDSGSGVSGSESDNSQDSQSSDDSDGQQASDDDEDMQQDSDQDDSEEDESSEDDEPLPPPKQKAKVQKEEAETEKPKVALFRPSVVAAHEAAKKLGAAVALNSKLERQVRGHVNRLSDQTMENIIKQVADLFEENSRNEMIEMISREVIAAVLRVPRNTYIPLYAAFIAGLAIQSESDLGPTFVEHVSVQFKKAFDGSEEQNDVVRNLALLLAHLYMFEVITATLIYDVIKLLANTLRENDMEVLLALFQTVGSALRGDDPLALKEVYTLVNVRAGEQQAKAVEGEENLRVKFMLETLRDLKNNKKKLAADSFQIQSLTKTVRHIRTTKGASKSILQISLDDLLNADTRGRWWRVGAAWAGHSSKPLAGAKPGTSQEDDDKLSQLANAQRMNTPLRRQIFLAIMESEDCVHAFERVMKLGLKEKQERDIVHVLLDCCAQEKSYNPFYSLLSQKLCEYHRRFQFTFQLKFWDYIKEMGSSDYALRKLSNLSRCLAHLFGTFALSLSILKAAPLEAPAPRQITFLQGVFTALFVQFPEETISSAFGRLEVSMELAILRDSISVFLKQYIKPKDSDFPIPLNEEQKNKVIENMKVAKKHLG